MPGRFLEWGRSPESGSIRTCICVCLCICIYKYILYTHVLYKYIQCCVSSYGSAKLTEWPFESKLGILGTAPLELEPTVASLEAAECKITGSLCRSLFYAKSVEKYSYFLIKSEEVY